MVVPPDHSPKRPFADTVDPDVFYRSPIHETVCAEIFAAAKAQAGFLVLSGEPGTGKTTVLRRVARDLEQAGGRVLWCSDILSLREVFRPVGGGPGGPDDATPAEALLATLQARVQSDGATVVAVDEAQRLEPAELGILRDLAEAGRRSGRPSTVLLAGLPGLDAKLASLVGTKAGRASDFRVRLSRLDPPEVRAYMAYRLEQAGLRLDQLFQAEAVERVAAYADGIPRVINHLCHGALRGAREAGLTLVSAPTVDAAARWLDLSRPAGAPLASAWPEASRRLKLWTGRRIASGRKTIRAWAPGVGIAALGLGAMAVFFALRPTSPPPSSRPEQAPPTQDRAGPPPVASARGVPMPPPKTARIIERPPPSTMPRRVERPVDTRPVPRPSVPGGRRGTPPRVVSAAVALLQSTEVGNLTEVRDIIEAGVSPNARDTAGMTPLMMAVIHDHGAIAEFLLAKGADVNAGDVSGVTALMLAANNGRAVLLKRLLARGARVDAQTRTGWTALTYAAWNGHPSTVRGLLESGADPALVDQTGRTALQYATSRAADPAALAAVAHARYVEVIDVLRKASRRR